MKKTVEEGTVLKEKVAEIFINGKSAMAVIICMITGFLYLQYGRDVKVTSSMNFSSANYYQMDFTVVANKLFIIDKQRFAEEMIERCIDNNFYDIKFSYDMMGYPNRLKINVYLNEFSKSQFTIRYMTESENGMEYNIKDNPDKYKIYIDNERQ